jgi:alpha-tubulin suppressor-like RCC1 family protein
VSRPPVAAAAGVSIPPGTDVLPADHPVTQLALGSAHTCVLLASGRVACWGDSTFGQLGNGSDQFSSTPVLVPGLFDAVEIQARDLTTCVRHRSGTVSCWGNNAWGQVYPEYDPALEGLPAPPGVLYCGMGKTPRVTIADVRRVPMTNRHVTAVQALSVGLQHTCALDTRGTVTCWGDAAWGQLGAEPPADAFQVQVISGLPPLVEMAAGSTFSCGRAASGSVWCWGGQLWGGPAARQVPGVEGAVGISVDGGRACARLGDGDVLCWGAAPDCGGIDGGQPPARDEQLAASVQFFAMPSACAVCLLDSEHRLECRDDTSSPRVVRLDGVSRVSTALTHACALRLDGSVWCWGLNLRGELARPVEWSVDLELKDARVSSEPLEPAPVRWPRHILDAASASE